MLDCNNNTKQFQDNNGIFKEEGCDYKYSLSEDQYNRLVYALETDNNQEILDIFPAKFRYIYEKIIKNLNIPSENLSIPITYIDNFDHIIEMISVYHHTKQHNIFNLLDDYAMSSIGLISTFIDFNNINFNDVKIKISDNITFKDYIRIFIDNYDPSNIDKINKVLLNKPEGKTKPIKTKSIIKKKGGTPLPIITEQSFIYNETIFYYFQNKDKIFPPAILEYDDENKQLIVVDGNHRLAFYIIRNIMEGKNYKIPVIIAIKDINEKFNDLI
jgi:sulfur relay (sulfurtransferase) DsrF/TusC family protein